MKLNTTVTFDSAHKLCLPYESKCSSLHGHTWKAEVEISCDRPKTASGIIIDFSLVKKFFSTYDHCYLNELPILISEGIADYTTAENLSAHFAKHLMDMLAHSGITGICAVKITLFETASNSASETLVYGL